MERVDLNSEVLEWVRYVPRRRILQVCLRNGRNYDYLAVPAAVFDELLAARSKGSYFNRRIRSKFLFTEVRDRRDAADG